MQVLLLQNVAGIGTAGQVKKVADGYARNYLLPHKLAIPANDGAIKQAESIKQAAIRRETKTKNEAEELAKLISQANLTFRAKAGEGERLPAYRRPCGSGGRHHRHCPAQRVLPNDVRGCRHAAPQL